MLRSVARRLVRHVLTLKKTTDDGAVHTVSTIDAMPYNMPNLVAMYLLTSSGPSHPPALAVVETNTCRAVPAMEAAIARAGFTLADVKYIIVTHVHLDHAAGAGTLLAKCANATVLCDSNARRHLIDPSRLLASARAVYVNEEEFRNECGDMIPCPLERVRAVGDKECVSLCPGRLLWFHHVEGHARHHVAVEDTALAACFTGDAFGVCSYWHLRDSGIAPGTFFPTTSPTDFDAAQAIESVERLARLGVTTMFPTHFGGCDGVAEGRDQLLRLLPLLDGLRFEAMVLLAFGAPRVRVDEFVRSGVRFVLRQHLTSRGLLPAAAERLFASDGAFRNDVSVNAMGLVHAAAAELSKCPSPSDHVRTVTCAMPLATLQARFPFVPSDIFAITPRSSVGHVVAVLLRCATSDAAINLAGTAAAEWMDGKRTIAHLTSMNTDTSRELLATCCGTEGNGDTVAMHAAGLSRL